MTTHTAGSPVGWVLPAVVVVLVAVAVADAVTSTAITVLSHPARFWVDK
jgi:hypothetical protein